MLSSLQQRFFSPIYLDERHFAMTLAAAFTLHAMIAIAYSLMPAPPVVDVPVQILSIKLGDGDDVEMSESEANMQADNQTPVEQVLSQTFTPPPAPSMAPVKALERAVQPEKSAVDNTKKGDALATPTPAAKQALEQIARQFVRERHSASMQSLADLSPSAGGAGSVLGTSSAGEAETLKRYEQLLSAWINKYKQYPEEARLQGMQGKGTIRIRIDRQGNIRYSSIEQLSGYPILDRAMLDMVKRANPVPPMPPEYPQRVVYEFLVPISFSL